MDTSIAESNNMRKYDKFAVAGFVLGLISVLFSPFWLITILLGYEDIVYNISNSWFGLFSSLTPVIPVATIIFSIIGMIRVKSTKNTKGLLLSIIGLILVLLGVVIGLYGLSIAAHNIKIL